MDATLPAGFEAIGRRFGEWYSPGMRTAAEALDDVDRTVMRWVPEWGARVDAAATAMRADADRRDVAAREAVVAADPTARDAVAPARWRNGLRVLSVLGGASAIASAITGFAALRGGYRAVDPAATAPLLALGGLLAVVAIVTSLLPPSRAGVPSRATAFLLEVFGAGTAAGAVVLWLARPGWSAATPVWFGVAVAASIAFAVAIVVVLAARMRISGARRRGHVAHDERLRALAPAIATELMEAADGELLAAWASLDGDVRDAFDRQRRIALERLHARGITLDGDALLAHPPGRLDLEATADSVLRRLDPRIRIGRERATRTEWVAQQRASLDLPSTTRPPPLP